MPLAVCWRQMYNGANRLGSVLEREEVVKGVALRRAKFMQAVTRLGAPLASCVVVAFLLQRGFSASWQGVTGLRRPARRGMATPALRLRS